MKPQRLSSEAPYLHIEYGGCDSARVARLGSHAAHGGRGGSSSASLMRVVVMARLARCACSGRCSWRLATIIIGAPTLNMSIYMAAALNVYSLI